MGSVLIELHDAMSDGQVIFSKDSLDALMSSNVSAKLMMNNPAIGIFETVEQYRKKVTQPTKQNFILIN